MDSMVTARVPVETKNRANKAFALLGISASQAINSLYEFVANTQHLPEFRTEEQILFEGRERVLDPETMTPKMKEMIRAIKAIESRGPIDLGEDAGKSSVELIEEARNARAEALLRY